MNENNYKEWFDSESAAQKAAERMREKGYETRVRYAMRADGSRDWILEVIGL